MIEGKHILDFSTHFPHCCDRMPGSSKEEGFALSHSSEGTVHYGREGLAAGSAWFVSVGPCGSCFLSGSDKKAESLGRKRGQDLPLKAHPCMTHLLWQGFSS